MEKACFGPARWIWAEDNTTCEQKVVFRRRFSIDTVPAKAEMLISCETKFWMWINGRIAVFEGAVFRESKPGCGYSEKVDIAPYLQKGENVIAILAYYYGNGGRNNVRLPEAGLIAYCEALDLFTDCNFLAVRHPAYDCTGEPRPAYLYGGDNVGFDAEKDFTGDFTAPDFDDSGFPRAVEKTNTTFGDAYISDLPLLKLYEKVENTEYGSEGNVYTASLPYAMTFSVIFDIVAEGGEVIDIRTDRYAVNGGPSDEHNLYNSHRIEYKCKKGENRWWCPFYLYGEKMIFTVPESVRVVSVGYQESGYDTQIVGTVKSGNPIIDRLVEKATRTLYVCMRNNFMDCPDRERGQWIGDVSVQASQVFYLLDSNAQALLKKSIRDFITLRRGDVLQGNVPGEHSGELPSQSLVAIGEFGLCAEYYNFTKDSSIFSLILEPAVNYLKLWSIDEKGLVIRREGGWCWHDHLYNIDVPVLENSMYYSALKQALFMAETIGDHRFDDFLNQRKEGIEKAFVPAFRTYVSESICYYNTPPRIDERANAFAVLSGLVPPEDYPHMRSIFISCFNCTPYMERFVLTAMCKMGLYEEAMRRMLSRYYNLAVNENSTLWEDFFILGTRNHAWSGAPAEIIFRYFLGIKFEDGCKTFTANPVKGFFKNITATFPCNGRLWRITVDEKGNAETKEIGAVR